MEQTTVLYNANACSCVFSFLSSEESIATNRDSVRSTCTHCLAIYATMLAMRHHVESYFIVILLHKHYRNICMHAFKTS